MARQIHIGLLTRQFDVRQALALRARSVHLNYTRFTSEIARICHQNGLQVYCYTVTDKGLAEKLAKQGVDGIFTNDITIFRE